MTNTDDKSVHDAVKKVYDLDIAAIRNLSNLAGELKNGNDVTIPGNLKVTGSINIETGNLNVETGNLNVEKGKILSKNLELLPPGTIVAWKGTTPPGGWALCDGNEGRPNLKGRFILGYGSGKGSSLNSTGGSETHTLTESEIPSHRHSINDIWQHYRSFAGSNSGAKTLKASKGTSGSVYIGYTRTDGGGNGAHNNMPPYYVLAYIIKL